MPARGKRSTLRNRPDLTAYFGPHPDLACVICVCVCGGGGGGVRDPVTFLDSFPGEFLLRLQTNHRQLR